MKKIKIIHVLYSFEVGGIETLVLQLCNNMDKEKYEVHIVTLTNDHLRMIKQLNEEIFVHSLKLSKKEIKTFFGLYSGFKQLVNLFNELKTDIIHTHLFFTPLLFVSVAIRFSKIKSLHFRTVHTAGLFYENQKTIFNKIKLLTEKIAMKLTKTYLISISNVIHKNNILYFKDIAQDIKIIPNGLDLKKYDKQNYTHISKNDFKISENSILITYVARLDNGKNHDFLIDMWSEIVKIVPNALLCFAGDGILKDFLIQKVKNNNLENSIKFLGLVTNVPELLSITDIGVFPSSFEGFSLVMLEKFAMKLPVVASDIEVFREIAKHNENALLIKLEEKDKFFDAIISLCKDYSFRERLGKRAYETAQRYSIDNTVKLHDEYYINSLNRLRTSKEVRKWL